LAKASAYAQQLQADLGGTELLQPLRHIFDQPLTEGYRRAVFVLTDGQVSNTQSVLDLVREHAASTSVYTVGIGESVSHHLVEGLAEAGQGTAEFVAGSERLEPKVIRLLQRSIRSDGGVRLTHVEWKGAGSGSVELLAPSSLGRQRKREFSGRLARHGVACNGDRVLVAALLRKTASTDTCTGAILHFQNSRGQTATLDIAATPSPSERGLHAAVGRALMKDMAQQLRSRPSAEEKAALEAQSVTLGIRLQLVSQFTSLIAIDQIARPLESDKVLCVSANQAVKVVCPGGESMVQVVRDRALLNHKMAAEGESGEERAVAAEKAQALYESAMAMAGSSLPVSHPLRLQTAMSFSSFLKDVQNRQEEACIVARTAFEDSICELDNVSEDTYKEATLHMQLLRDSLAAWTAHAGDDSDADKHERVVCTLTPVAPSSLAPAASVTAALAAGPARGPVPSTLQALLMLQSFDGYWSCCDGLASALLSSPECLVPEIGVSGLVWGTALALAFLQLRLADSADEWVLVASKARAWLETSGCDQEALVARASARLQCLWQQL
jgi:hypothetical protein